MVWPQRRGVPPTSHTGPSQSNVHERSEQAEGASTSCWCDCLAEGAAAPGACCACAVWHATGAVSYTHLRAHETLMNL
eukprot:5696875-Prymnesium_polylepis.1